MATREMTKEEAKILLSDKKIACFSMEETIAVQEMLLGLGFIWIDSTREVYGDAFLIFTRNDGCMCTTDNIKIWVGEKKAEIIKASEILTIKIKEKPKFDPKTLKPFDMVLVRDNADFIWKCNLFSHIQDSEGFCYQCVSYGWRFCIPYNEETKHLLGTKEEEPEYYQICEK